MRKKLQQGSRQKNKIRARILLASVILSGCIFMISTLLVLFNINNASKSKASDTGRDGGGSELNSGEVICEFTWEQNPVTQSKMGPDAIQWGSGAHSMAGGRASTNGLSAGTTGKGVDLVLQANELFKLDGIDISVDFKRNEPSGEFFSRGNTFSFGMDNGILTINYCLENKLGRTSCVKEKTNYEIASDDIFRNYRFMFTPSTGKAEIFVNSIIVWQNQHEKNSYITWKNADNIIIGKNLDGGSVDKPILDNLVIRSTGSAIPITESLLNFMLEAKDGGVNIHWSTSANNHVQFFSIEKSTNGRDFVSVANVNSKADSIEEYTFVDKSELSSSLVYYRLRQNFKNGKHVSHTLSALRLKSDKDFSLEQVSPSPFKKTCDISYFLPRTGRVWIQVSDEKGKIINTESFEAPQGKNVHVFNDDKNLQSGTYTFSVMFDNKKVSKKVVKW